MGAERVEVEYDEVCAGAVSVEVGVGEWVS